MFQIAFVLRERLVTARMPPVIGSGSENPWMPCLYARLPVAIEVHRIGLRTGWRVAMFPQMPSSISLARFGIFPESMSGMMTLQSAASQPIRSTFRGRRSVRTAGMHLNYERLEKPKEAGGK